MQERVVDVTLNVLGQATRPIAAVALVQGYPPPRTTMGQSDHTGIVFENIHASLLTLPNHSKDRRDGLFIHPSALEPPHPLFCRSRIIQASLESRQ